MAPTRRMAMLGMAAAGVSAAPVVPLLGADGPARALRLTASERPRALLGPGRPETRQCCLYNDDPALAVRVPRGTNLLVDFENRLPGPTTVHWHGIRVPNLSDGVAPLTQRLVMPNERFHYDVPLPDAGFYFFHPHCDEAGQIGRGLFALLLVEHPDDPSFDLEHVIVVKDWRLDDDGQFLAMSTEEGAAAAGTFGTVRSTPMHIEAPAHGDVRLRVIVADSTRLIDFGCDTPAAAIIACDGQAIAPLDFHALPDEVWRMGPGMRLDVHLRMPEAGKQVRVYDYRSADPFLLATLAAVDRGKARTPFRPKSLPRATAPAADIARARRIDMLIQVAVGPTIVAPGLPPGDPLATALSSAICVGQRTHWAINRTSWSAGDALRLPPPLATLRHGQSYVLSITNATKHAHPMHLHGHVFKVLASSKKAKLPPHLADTVMAEPSETVDIAFKATRGNWAFHCHVAEHMDTGMMGWFKVA